MPRQSTWNMLAPLIAGLLIVLIVFAYIGNRMKEDKAVAREAENAALKEQYAREEKERDEADKKRREEVAQKMRDALEAKNAELQKNQLWNWVRQKETVVSQSATREPYNAGAAADGNKDGSLASGSVSFALPVLNREKRTKTPAWWMADLGKERRITEIMLYNCTDGDFGKRLSNFRITILDKNKQSVYERDFFTGSGEYAGKITKIEIPDGTFGRWFRIKLNGPNALNDGALNLAEVEILGPPPSGDE